MIVPIQIKVTEGLLETIGAGTLIGLYGQAIIESGGSPFRQPLQLIFPETSLKWRQENGGPKQYIVSEYAFHCMLDDILYLQSQGVIVSTRTEAV